MIKKQPLVLRKALELYQSDCFEKINAFLRTHKGLDRGTGEKLKHLKWDFSQEEAAQFNTHYYDTEGVIDALDTLINMTTIDSDMILYRGSGGNGDLNEFSQLNVTSIEDLINATGKKFTQYSYTSTTPVLLGRFADECPVILAIRVPKGTHLLRTFSGRRRNYSRKKFRV